MLPGKRRHPRPVYGDGEIVTEDQTDRLSLRYDSNGLIAAIAQDVGSREILMLAWMNESALMKTLETGEAHYWSRSRQALWHKGATSGATQTVHEIRVDCDQDAVILMVTQKGGGACHTGKSSCFYRTVDPETPSRLIFLRQS
jgi:phosphoribosyl-AMP cyclohydrolase